MPQCTSSTSSRHSLLMKLQELILPLTSTAEQRRIVNTLYDVNLATLEECLLQICHVCLTHPNAEMQEPLRNFIFWLASKSLYLALRLSWCVDAVFSFFIATSLCDRVRDLQDSIESYAINQVDYRQYPNNDTVKKAITIKGSNNVIKDVNHVQMQEQKELMVKEQQQLDSHETEHQSEMMNNNNSSSIVVGPETEKTAEHLKGQSSAHFNDKTKTAAFSSSSYNNNNSDSSITACTQPCIAQNREKVINQTKQCSHTQHNNSVNSNANNNRKTLRNANAKEMRMEQKVNEVYSLNSVLRKERRLKLFTDERQFINTLTDISHLLRAFPERARRKTELHNRLREINTCLPHMLLIHPLGTSNDAVCWIVNIVVEECTVFSSRTRAPYLIQYEVIVDHTTTMRDPTQSLLRRDDGEFRIRAPNSLLVETEDYKHHCQQEEQQHEQHEHNSEQSNKVNFYEEQLFDPEQRIQGHITNSIPASSRINQENKRKISYDQGNHENNVSAFIGANATTITTTTTTAGVMTPLSIASQKNDDAANKINNKINIPNEHMSTTQVLESEFDSPYLKRAFGQSLAQRTAAIRRRSKWGRHPNWALRALIVKAGDDLRQEELALQVVHWFTSTWREAGVTCLAYPYQVISTSPDCGVVEVVEDSTSVDAIKKSSGVTSLWQFFVKAFNGENSVAYERAQRNFVETMAAYSVITYVLQVKDRHNGNLMVSRFGHITHIDFGFLIATSPGGLNFESAPFKLSQELIDVMGGVYGDAFKYYKILVYQAMETIRTHADDVVMLVKLMLPFNTMPCFGADPHNAVGLLRSRFRYDLPSGVDYALYIRDLIVSSIDNWRTRRYDQFQTLQNGIL